MNDDLISRDAVIYYIKGHIHEIITESGKDMNAHTNRVLRALINGVETMPPVNPQEPMTGHWIEKDGYDGDVYYDCSECGESWTTIEGTPWDNEWNYCPNCGAKMESEDK